MSNGPLLQRADVGPASANEPAGVGNLGWRSIIGYNPFYELSTKSSICKLFLLFSYWKGVNDKCHDVGVTK